MKWTPIRPLTAFASILFLATPTLAVAGTGSLSPGELDSRIDQVIRRAIGIGAPLYNQGDQAGCYRLYQGTLLAIEPMLDHRAELRREVAQNWKAVEFLPTYAQRATDLRRILDQVLSTIRSTPIPAQVRASPAAPAPASAPAPAPVPDPAIPLWTRLGGEPAVRAVVHEFVALAASDPQVDFSRGGKYPLDDAAVARLEALLVQLISAVAGGPLRYEGRAMAPVHRGMAISDAQFDALAGDLVVVLRKLDVPRKEADELLAIVASTRKDIVEAEPQPRPRGR